MPPVLTPTRIADRGPAPLARTAEIRLSPTVYFEQKRLPSEHHAARFTLGDVHDMAVHPNLTAAFAFTDSFALVLPAGVLWSPVVQRERGTWLTLGGGIYGLGIGSGFLSLTDGGGVWAKRRFGSDVWLTGGLAVFHSYYSDAHQPVAERPVKNVVWLIPAAEVGVQLADAWALTLLADYGAVLISDVAPYSRLQTEIMFVPAWWIDIGIHGGVHLHARGPWHVDPLVGFTATARW